LDPDKSISLADYELKVDEQVEKLLESKQKLIYFVVTASAASIAFAVDFASKNPHYSQDHLSTSTFLANISGICGQSL